MDNTAPTTKERIVPEVAFGIAVMRGVAAIGIGLLLIFYPEKSGKVLANMMGFFWLISGIALLRRSKDDPLIQMVGTRTTRIIAVVGLLTGLLVVTRSLSQQVLPQGTLIVLLGVVIVLTGLLHAFANLRVGATRSRHNTLNLVLGIFEIVFGLTLIISPLDRSPASYWVATIWALVFGVLVIGDAISQQSQAHKAEKPTTSDDTTVADKSMTDISETSQVSQ